MNMKKVTYLWLAACMLLTVCIATSCKSKAQPQTEPEPRTFSIQKGVNIGNWLSQSNIVDNRRDSIFTEDDIRLLADNGFDHIRLPVDEVQLFNEDMTLNDKTVDILCRTLDLCMKHDLKVIVDLHIIRAHHFLDKRPALWENAAEQDKLVSMWRTLQGLLHEYPVDKVAYEILNEAVAPQDELWADLLLRVVNAIRETEKDRTIVMGANQFNSVERVKNIKLPEGDKNILLTFHFYEPLLLTHYQASWTAFKDLQLKGSLQYPGQLITDEVYNQLTQDEKAIVEPYRHEYNQEWMKQTWQQAMDFARQNGLKLYLGEFGSLVNCGEAVRLAWLKDVVELCRENNIAYSLWEYNSQFGFASRTEKGKVTNQAMLDILVK